MLALILLCVSSGLVEAAAPFIASGIPGEIRTNQDEPIIADSLKLSTPRDLDTVPAHAAPFTFRSTPPIDFTAVRQITFTELPIAWQGSRPDAVESYYLGNEDNAVPPPPDWARTVNQIPPWSQSVATSDTAGLPYLNHAVFCWAPNPANALASGPKVFLFRQKFTLDSQLPIAHVTLRIATNARLLEATLDEKPLHLIGSPAPWALAEYEVTPWIQSGANILALKVAERADHPDAKYGVAFHLEIARRAALSQTTPADASAALLNTADGQRLWGRVASLRGDLVSFSTPYGQLDCAWGNCIALAFPLGYAPAAPPGGFFDHPPLPPGEKGAPLFMMPLQFWPAPADTSFALTEQRTAAGRPGSLVHHEVNAQSTDGTAFHFPADQLRGIYPRRDSQRDVLRPNASDTLLYCRLVTTQGERAEGLLREMDSRHIRVDPPTAASTSLTFDPKWVASLTFPWHGLSIPPPQAQQHIGILPRLPGDEHSAAQYDQNVHEIVTAAFVIGLTPEPITLETLADASQLTPQRYPIICKPDPTGDYLTTLNTPGDAQDALLAYIKQGGKLIALAPGGAFRIAVQKTANGQFAHTVPNHGIAETMGLKVLRPSETPGETAQAFDHPPNQGELLYFERGSAAQGPLRLLPHRQLLQGLEHASFYPQLPPPGTAPLYALVNSAGVPYGPALTSVAYGRGQLISIDPLLWNCPAEGQPFCRQLLPTLFALALQ